MKNRIRSLAFLTASLAVSSALFAQADMTPPPAPADPNSPAAVPPGGGDAGGQRGNRAQRGNFNPEEMRTRMMANLREQFGVTKDDEWNLISERINAVAELRRAGFPGFGGGFRVAGGPGGGGDGGGQNRRGGPGGPGASPEADALRSAITDNLPAAEIQARLTRLREVRKENETKLAKAQEDLRAVLNVRQEATAVLNGLLP